MCNNSWGAILTNGIDDGWPETGYLRLQEVLKRVPVKKSAWYQGIKDGKFPKSTDKFAGIAAYEVNEIRGLLGVELAKNN